MVQETTATHPETNFPPRGQDLASTIMGHRKGPFPLLPVPLNHLRKSAGGSVVPSKAPEGGLSLHPSSSSTGSWVCYTSACIKSRVRDWPYDRDGNLA